MIILGNLDCEAYWSGSALPQHVARRVSAAAALLAGFARDGDSVEIFAPAPVNGARIRIPGVTMRVGVPARWDLAWADPDAKAVNDRRHTVALRERLGLAMPGARSVGSLAELESTLRAMPDDMAWVCKAPWTAAGRDRSHGRGSQVGAEQRTHLARMIERSGGVVVEPWLDRVLDLGVCGHVAATGLVELEPPHTLLASARGTFLGIDLAPPPLAEPDRELLDRTARHAGRWLHDAAYAGPFAVDAFVYREASGRHVLHALCELNARHTFGHVTRALAARHGIRRLGFGTPPEGSRVLVAASEDDPIAAWAAT
jgi:hypothetical protein